MSTSNILLIFGSQKGADCLLGTGDCIDKNKPTRVVENWAPNEIQSIKLGSDHTML